MKKIFFYMLLSVAVVIPTTGIQARSLVVYFSHSGNTRTVAEQIKSLTGADIFEIIPKKSYPSDYQTVVDQARNEIRTGVRPAIKGGVSDIASYDTLYVGSPCWWGTIAPPVATFLATYDLSGKTIVPFMTHEGSRMGHSEEDIRQLCSRSTILKGLPIRGSQAALATPEIKKWLQEIAASGKQVKP